MKERIIALIGGESGSGKSFFACQFPRAVIYDTDLGGGAAYLDDQIAANQSIRVEVASYAAILADLRGRANQGQLPDTVVIDHLTNLHQVAVLRANPTLVADYGRGASKATAEWRHVREFARTVDCHLICTAHLKGDWAGDKQIGWRIDAGKNIEADFHLVLRLAPRVDHWPARAHVQKWRRHPADPRGVIPESFDLDMENFLAINGPISSAGPPGRGIRLASPAQVERITSLLAKLKMPPSWAEQCFAKAGVDKWEEISEEHIIACVDYLTQQEVDNEQF